MVTLTVPFPFSRTIVLSSRAYTAVLVFALIVSLAVTIVTANPNNAVVLIEPADSTILGVLANLVWITRGHIIVTGATAMPGLLLTISGASTRHMIAIFSPR